MATSESIALLLVPAFDRAAIADHATPTRTTVAHLVKRMSSGSFPTLLVRPAPLPRPLAVRSDNVGLHAAAAARREAIATSRFEVDLSLRSHCWRGMAPDEVKSPKHVRSSGRLGSTCPLRRETDCVEWPSSNQSVTTASLSPLPTGSFTRADLSAKPATITSTASPPVSHGGILHCLPSVLILGARGCGSSLLHRILAVHPHVVSAPASMNPWWAYDRLGVNFTSNVLMCADCPKRPLARAELSQVSCNDRVFGQPACGRQRAAARLLSSPRHSLLLQHAPLDALSAGVGTSLQSAGISLGELLLRVQVQPAIANTHLRCLVAGASHDMTSLPVRPPPLAVWPEGHRGPLRPKCTVSRADRTKT